MSDDRIRVFSHRLTSFSYRYSITTMLTILLINNFSDVVTLVKRAQGIAMQRIWKADHYIQTPDEKLIPCLCSKSHGLKIPKAEAAKKLKV